jgi:hypothetical protein
MATGSAQLGENIKKASLATCSGCAVCQPGGRSRSIYPRVWVLKNPSDFGIEGGNVLIQNYATGISNDVDLHCRFAVCGQRKTVAC